MSSASFRLESFRPWNPFHDKAQPPRDDLGLCRYPSPVSITATPPASNTSYPVSKSQKSHSHKPERHPLPARPPVEVCLDDGLHSDTQITRYEPEDLGRTISANTQPETFDSEESLQLQDLPGTEDIDSTILSDNICDGAEHQSPGFEPGDLEPAVIAGQHPQAVDSGNPIQSREPPDIETIDPAILNDRDFPGAEQIQATENITSIATCPDRCPSKCSHFRNKDHPSQCRRRNAKGMVNPDGQSSKIKKRSSAGKRHRKNGPGRSNKEPGDRKGISFPTIRAQFSALPVEDRLQFLSWLFEGALSHCVSTPLSADAVSASRCIRNQDVDITYECDHPSSDTELVDAQHTPTRKGLPWSVEEGCLLVKLREEQKLAWSEVTKRFAQKFPGRSKGSIQVYWSTTLKSKRTMLSNHLD